MANAFTKQETVAFDDICQGFEDALVMSKAVSKMSTDPVTMERSNDTMWLPMPYIMRSNDGPTATYSDVTQLSVPATVGFDKNVAWKLTSTQLRDMMQNGQITKAAKERLASDVNISIRDKAVDLGSIVVKRTAAASGYDDIAECEAFLDEQGIARYGRYIAIPSRDYNSMASDLAGKYMQRKAENAYEKSTVGENVANFDSVLKLDHAKSLSAAGGSSVTINGANQYHTPAATSTAASGETSNVDNRYQNLAITVGSGTVAVGDCFTIANVYAVNHITKESTGQLKTFRITEIVSGAGGTGTVKITPAIVSNGGSTDAEAMYQNVDSTPADGAAITFLNTVGGRVTPFWQEESIQVIPSTIGIEEGTGAKFMKATVEGGFTVYMMKQWDLTNRRENIRVDCRWGTVNLNPEMNGIMLFSQT